MKAPLILVPSKRMDSNRKEGRRENSLIRMSKAARQNLGLNDDKTVEVWPDTTDESSKIHKRKALSIFQAFSKDLKELRESNMSENEWLRVGFVTSTTFEFICGEKRTKSGSSIWISDSVEETVIGGDPEFILLTDNNLIQYAGHVNGLSSQGALAHDGPLAEVRPEPSIDVDTFVKSIEKIMNTHPNTDIIEPYSWMAGSYFYGSSTDDYTRSWPIGGHIHIGNPSKLEKALNEYKTIKLGYQNWNTLEAAVFSCLSKILDEFVGIASIKLDGKDKAIKRRQEYGQFLSYRHKYGRLEYRTLSGEWLSHPQVAIYVIGAVKAVAHAFFKVLDENDNKDNIVMTPAQLKYVNNPDQYDQTAFNYQNAAFCYWKDIEIMKIFDTVKNSSTMIHILNEGDIRFTKAFFDRLTRMFRNLPTYKEYAKYVDGFLELMGRPFVELEKINRNLKETWVGGEKLNL